MNQEFDYDDQVEAEFINRLGYVAIVFVIAAIAFLWVIL